LWAPGEKKKRKKEKSKVPSNSITSMIRVLKFLIVIEEPSKNVITLSLPEVTLLLIN